MENAKSVFETLSAVDCADKIEKKNNLSYLSWSYAWGELLKRYPDSTYKIYENNDGWNYFTDGRTCWVKTGVTVKGIEHIEYLPVMDFRNKSIPANAVTSFDVNKAIQRSLTKAIARHGLGLYIYAGEDLPEGSEEVVVNISEIRNKQTTEETKNVNLGKLKADVNKAIMSGQLQGDFSRKAQYYIDTNNVDGLQGVLNYLVDLEARGN